MIYFEPEEPILTKEDFTKELLVFKQKEQNDLYILKEGMEPLVELMGKTYCCMLEPPRMLQSNQAVVTAMSFISRSYGYKFVYFHPIEIK